MEFANYTKACSSDVGVNFSWNNSYVVSFSDWLEHIIIDEGADVSQVVLSICYEIRWIRNKRCFEGIEIHSASNCYKSAIKAIFNGVQNELLQS